MNTVSKKHIFFTGLMLFSLFFGAGNLIFPPMLGQNAGENFWPAMIGFLLTGVGLPLLTVIAISLSGNGMQQLASHVHPLFGIFFTVIVYIAIGPSMGIPRVANVAYEMGVSSFLPETIRSSSLVLFVYTIIFFTIVFWLSLNPSKLVDRIGNVLTPILLLSIFLLFVKSVFTPLGQSGPAMQEYQTSPIFKGFMEGYLTMDTISALAFGIIVVNAIRSKGVNDRKSIAIATAKAGLIAATGLVLVYGALGWLGATSVSLGYAKNGGQLLTVIVQQLFGPYGFAPIISYRYTRLFNDMRWTRICVQPIFFNIIDYIFIQNIREYHLRIRIISCQLRFNKNYRNLCSNSTCCVSNCDCTRTTIITS